MLEIAGREADGGRRCTSVGCGTAVSRSAARLGVRIDAGCIDGRSPDGSFVRGDTVDAVEDMTRAIGVPREAHARPRHRPVGSPSDPS